MRGPYHMIPIGILLILIYLGSLLSVRLQLLELTRHKRIWNLLLLVFFLSVSLLGLFLAIRVNYKLNIPWVDQVMQWHVELGAGMTFVAIFHLTWHLGYYRKALSERGEVREKVQLAPFLEYNPLQVRTLFLLLGFITMITQLVLIREYIKTLHGNELVIGLFLAIWMVVTAAGAGAGARYGAKMTGPTLLKSMLLLAGFPLVIYLLLVIITRLILPPGFVPGILSSLSMMLLIFPFTLGSGFLFSYFARAVKGVKVDAKFYMLDSLGALAGGLLFGLFLVFFLNNLQVIVLLLLVTTIALVLIFKYPVSRTMRTILIGSGTILLGISLLNEVTNGIESLRFKGETVLESKDTPHGNLSFTEREGLITGYLDRNPVVSSYEPAVCEEQVHYPSLQHPDPTSFLLIGGGLSGLDAEISKYRPSTFYYCESNRWMYRMGQRHMPASGKHRYIDVDGRSWLAADDTTRYDVIISTAGEPLTLGWNRYFTIEFFRLAASRLNPGGIFSLQLPAGGSYVSETGSKQLGITYKTLKRVFDHVTIVPGYATYFLASDRPLSLDIPGLLEKRSIPTTYVHPHYIDASRLLFESDILIERVADYNGRINSDLHPVLFFKSIVSWNLQTDGNRLIFIFLLSLLILLLLLISYSRNNTSMFVAGFTGAGMQIVLIMVMQSFYGFAYLVTPLMITLFMGGLVAGTVLWRVVWKEPSVTKNTGLMWIMALVGAVAVILLKNESVFSERWIGMAVLGGLNLISGLLVGSVYGMVLARSTADVASGAGKLYSADLAGAAMGSLIPPLFLVPLIGVSNTFILFCGINVAAGLYISLKLKGDG
ncbi:MAG: hypothetical protein ABFS10_11705 [Bacteroidota bacterium]